jgi:aminoglycoside phosphotransferase family enzyme
MNTFSKMMILTVMVTGMHFAQADTTAATPVSPVVTTAPVVGSKIDMTVQKQDGRIDHKVQKGKITQAQGDQLKQQVNAVETQKQAMIQQNGGKPLTKAQRQQLHQELKQTSQEIKTAKAGSPVTPVTQ